LVAKIELFDVYRGEELGEGKKSLAFHIWYQSPERTLTSQEVEEAEKAMLERMSERFAAKVRSI
jgi:phenylalanyl-tRNA synthetase beta chain